MDKINVLVIDDDPNILKLLGELLSAKPNYALQTAGDGKEAARCFAEQRVDVVLTDIHMPGFTGLELMADMQKLKFKPEILVMTANATPENVEKARAIGARSLVLKPFDNLEVVEEEIEKAAQAVRDAAAAAGGMPQTQGIDMAAAAPAPAPKAGPARAAASPESATGGDPGGTVRVDVPEIDSWKSDLVGNETPDPGGEAGSRQDSSKQMAARAEAARAAATGRAPGAPPAATSGIRGTASAAKPRAVTKPAPPAPAAAPAPPQGDAPAVDAREFVPSLPPEIESVLRAGAGVDAARMKMQVPIVCLQTLEEQGAIGALRALAADLKRSFQTWSASRGIQKPDGETMGDVYRDPNRALEYIRRQKALGLYVLADFRQCLEDRTVVRTLREMVMEGETSRALIVLTAPRLIVPPELEAASVAFAWPEGEGFDMAELYEEVLAEVAASSGRPVRLGEAVRQALLSRVKEMPVGRARFEIAKELMARTRGRG